MVGIHFFCFLEVPLCGERYANNNIFLLNFERRKIAPLLWFDNILISVKYIQSFNRVSQNFPSSCLAQLWKWACGWWWSPHCIRCRLRNLLLDAEARIEFCMDIFVWGYTWFEFVKHVMREMLWDQSRPRGVQSHHLCSNVYSRWMCVTDRAHKWWRRKERKRKQSWLFASVFRQFCLRMVDSEIFKCEYKCICGGEWWVPADSGCGQKDADA